MRSTAIHRHALVLWLTAVLFPGGVAAQRVVDHELQVHLDPVRGHIEVRDVVTLPEGSENGEGVTFLLNDALRPQAAGRLEALEGDDGRRAWRIHPMGSRSFTLHYAGTIQGGVRARSEGIGKTQASSRGHIGADGVFLDGASGWYPYLPDSLQTFRLRVTLPAGWQAVSQGQGPAAVGQASEWTARAPQDDIYLIAAPFTFYRQATPFAEAQAYLRQPDEGLARRYLEVTADYLDLYSRLIGPYPYAKFAVVENFWESGYGMPSFTLLGPRVLRLPFILHSSYPHEILHNWWGNSIYVDYAHGNWSEGLTTYLADHLVQEREGKGADYRRDALKRYSEFVRTENDFPVIKFTARHGEASQAVGYDKVLMIFHMLRRELGDAAFVAGLQNFYRDFRFKTAGFADILRSFEGVARDGQVACFHPWLMRTGAPTLRLGEVSSSRSASGHRLVVTLAQTQEEDLFIVPVSLAIQLEGRDVALVKTLTLAAREQIFSLDLPARPQRIAVDPGYDLLRRLDPAELPPSLARLFAASRLTLVLPVAADKAHRDGYLQLARAWAAGQPQVRIIWDKELKTLPREGAVWVLGWANRFSQAVLRQLPAGQAVLGEAQAVIAGERIALADHSLVLAATGEDDQPLALLAAHEAAAISGLGRKVPHYGKYSYLAFHGRTADNVLKGQWPVSRSPLHRALVPDAPPLSLPPRPPLTAVLD